ncbi:hypothetical protein KFK09_018533 [Dendrobium nobile]|uniref:Uncharacterized protein n=1 Tax=Dendrobium nobile TaxID=94219 RepID=A0A8T3AW41_DENNO|nr:hypothetical protein KFK09_018533 [Dendrobium nobile]
MTKILKGSESQNYIPISHKRQNEYWFSHKTEIILTVSDSNAFSFRFYYKIEFNFTFYIRGANEKQTHESVRTRLVNKLLNRAYRVSNLTSSSSRFSSLLNYRALVQLR